MIVLRRPYKELRKEQKLKAKKKSKRQGRKGKAECRVPEIAKREKKAFLNRQ